MTEVTDLVALSRRITGKIENSGTGKDCSIETLADALYDKMLHSFEELTIKKYGHVSEENLQKVFRKIEERTRDRETPVIYLAIDPEIMRLDMQEDRTGFYRDFVGRVLDSVEQTRCKDEKGVKKIRELYETNFGFIYNSDFYSDSLLSSCYNVGSNLSTLMGLMIKDRANYPLPLINITVLPNFPKNSVTVQREVKDALMRPDAKEFERATSYASSIMQTFFLGAKGLSKCIAVPGWTVDVLTYSWDNQKWNTSGWAEGGIIEELGYRKTIEL